MGVDFDVLVKRLQQYPAKIHALCPPCPEDRLAAVERDLGGIPQPIASMLRHFNGAELFIDGGPYFTFFGVSLPEDDSTEFDWFIDRYTQAWRSAGSGRSTHWAIGIKCYGALIILDEHSIVSEWDRAFRRWDTSPMPFAEWLEMMLAEGDDYLNIE